MAAPDDRSSLDDAPAFPVRFVILGNALALTAALIAWVLAGWLVAIGTFAAMCMVVIPILVLLPGIGGLLAPPRGAVRAHTIRGELSKWADDLMDERLNAARVEAELERRQRR